MSDRTYMISITDETGETYSEELPADQPVNETVGTILIEQIGWQQAKTVTIWIGEVRTDA